MAGCGEFPVVNGTLLESEYLLLVVVRVGRVNNSTLLLWRAKSRCSGSSSVQPGSSREGLLRAAVPKAGAPGRRPRPRKEDLSVFKG